MLLKSFADSALPFYYRRGSIPIAIIDQMSPSWRLPVGDTKFLFEEIGFDYLDFMSNELGSRD